ncbi:MAG: GNAT family N-acetyltransferase [Syntrophales bacterium]
MNCSILQAPTDEEVRQIVGLYRGQGWWLASDEGKESLLPRLISGSHCFVIARRGANIVGMGRAISDGISDAYIQDLTVHPDCRNRGIGGMILRTLLDRLHADGIGWIGLIAEPGSHNLYQRAGFREMAGSSPMLMIEEP